MSRSKFEQLELEVEEFLWPIFGFAIFRIFSAVVRLGIPDVLGDSAKTVEELAAATSAHPDSVYRLLRAAALLAC